MVEGFFVVIDFFSISVPPADKTHLTMVLSEERSSWAEGGPVLFIFSYHRPNLDPVPCAK